MEGVCGTVLAGSGARLAAPPGSLVKTGLGGEPLCRAEASGSDDLDDGPGEVAVVDRSEVVADALVASTSRVTCVTPPPGLSSPSTSRSHPPDHFSARTTKRSSLLASPSWIVMVRSWHANRPRLVLLCQFAMKPLMTSRRLNDRWR